MTEQKREWTFCGRYGDENNTIHIKKLPEELSDHMKEALIALYRKRDGEYGKHGYDFEEFGLLRQVGNAWHHSLLWAPQVHAWMKKSNPNDAIASALKAQYE